MVQLFYHESRGSRCSLLLTSLGLPRPLLLYPDEGWVEANSSYWLVERKEKVSGLLKEKFGKLVAKLLPEKVAAAVLGRCSRTDKVGGMRVVAVSGRGSKVQQCVGHVKVTEEESGVMVIRGRLKRCKPSGGRDFLLTLTTDITDGDFMAGYALTGTVEQGDLTSGRMYFTHFAVIKRDHV